MTISEQIASQIFTQKGTGSVTRTNQDKATDTLSVKDYGAVCDSTTNDYTALTNAITAATDANVNFIQVPNSEMYFTTAQIPSHISFGNPVDLVQGSNLVPNNNFSTWQRVDVRALSPAQFNVYPPTFGTESSYDGTGGLKVYTADMWYGQVYGLYGNSVVTRKAITPQESTLTYLTEYCCNWVATSVTPPAAFSKIITNITTATTATVTVTSANHGLANGTWVWLQGTTYTGGLGSLVNQPNEASFQISNVTTNTFDISITPDAGFTGWTAFGTINNDPDGTGLAHVYDASLVNASPKRRKWIRNGTASHVLSCRVPSSRFPDGIYTVRLRMRRNSGEPIIRARVGYDFGSGGSPSSSVTSVALLATPTTGTDIIDYVGTAKIPSISSSTFGSTNDTGYLSVDIGADPTSFDVDIFYISVRPGSAALPNDSISKQETMSYCRQFYRGVRLGTSVTAVSGSYYGASTNFDPPMRGTPTISYIRPITLTNFNAPSTTNNASKEGMQAVAQATAAAVGVWAGVFEAEYVIPT